MVEPLSAGRIEVKAIGGGQLHDEFAKNPGAEDLLQILREEAAAAM